MISDTLSDAIHHINRYLDSPTFDNVYAGLIRREIVELVEQMEKVRIILDTPPGYLPEKYKVVKK